MTATLTKAQLPTKHASDFDETRVAFGRLKISTLDIRDPALQCKLFDTLVLPILSYGCEVWGVDTKCGAAAEALPRDFLRRLLGVKQYTANHMVLAELGRFLLQIHFWQQNVRYHHRTMTIDNMRLVKLAIVDRFALDQTAVKDSWPSMSCSNWLNIC